MKNWVRIGTICVNLERVHYIEEASTGWFRVGIGRRNATFELCVKDAATIAQIREWLAERASIRESPARSPIRPAQSLGVSWNGAGN